MDISRLARIAAAAVFVAVVPVFLIAGSVRLAVNLPLLYTYGFDRYNIPEYTAIERHDLLAAGAQIRDYFNNDDEWLIIRTFVGGVLVESLYNQREIIHMRDVKALVQGVYMVQALTGAYIAVFATVGFVLMRRKFWLTLGRYVSMGGILTLGLVAAVGLAALVGFDRLFLAFHLISFSNDFWMLDPRRDYLIAMFPQGFFFDATMLVALLTVVGALLCVGLPRLGAWWARRSPRAAQGA